MFYFNNKIYFRGEDEAYWAKIINQMEWKKNRMSTQSRVLALENEGMNQRKTQ